MELEFDKEMDAMLRRARSTGESTVGTHLDADTISAFVENALPQAAKLLYTGHLADCGRCRQQLSNAILINTEADAAAASTISDPVVVGTSLPGYHALFKTRNFALAMGAMLLAFTGGIGYLLLQGMGKGEGAVTISQVQEDGLLGDLFPADRSSANANSGAPLPGGPAADNSANASNSAASANTTAVTADKSGRTDTREKFGATTEDEAPKPVDPTVSEILSPAPPPPPIGSAAGEGKPDSANDADEDKSVAENSSLARSRRKENDDEGRRYRRDAPPPASKSGPARAGPLQSQTNQSSNTYEMSVIRAVGGKKFNNRDGAWYDTAYRGQATINYRRTSEDYKKLDRGLRDIAETLGGTVVVVWKGKAYRIS